MKITENIYGVGVELFDVQDAAKAGVSPGAYYNIPSEEEPDAIRLEGPFETTAAAREAARVFLSDAMADDVSEEEIDLEEVEATDPVIFPVDAAEAA